MRTNTGKVWPASGNWKALMFCALAVLGGCGGGGPVTADRAVASPEAAVTAGSQTELSAQAANVSAANTSAARPAPRTVLYDILQITDRPDPSRSTFDLNAKGQVAFGEVDETGQLVGKFYDGTNFHRIGILASQESVPIIALNDVGQVAGQAVFGENVFHAFRWSRKTGIVDLGVLQGSDESLGTDINNKGEVVGVVRTLDQSRPARAVLWPVGARPIELGVKGNVFPTLRNNDAGQVMGTTTGRNGFEQAFSWTRSKGPVLLSGRGINFSIAKDINAHGQIAGVLGRKELALSPVGVESNPTAEV